jgi:uncharacterized membrane protein YphA (DoxX/SURF4 family)
MKSLISLSRILVGSIFILSGLIKANDALGFSYKLDEYFSEAVFNLPFLQEYALAVAIFVCLAEIVLGVMLIIAYKPKATKLLLLAFLIFFGFLTFYSAYYNKVTDCGCFGDAVKFTPWQSFMKDVVLLVLFLPFIFGSKHESLKDEKNTKLIVLISIVFIAFLCLVQFNWYFPIGFTAAALVFYLLPIKVGVRSLISTLVTVVLTLVFVNYTYTHLPLKDYRPYKKEANITEGMELPTDAKPEITHVFIENVTSGEVKGVEMKDIPWDDKNWKYRTDMDPEIIQEGDEPPIHDFSIVNQKDEDITEDVLLWDKALLVVSYDYEKSSAEGWKKGKKLINHAKEKGIGVMALTASDYKSMMLSLGKLDIYIPFGTTDETTLKTIVRSNPGYIYLENGTIKQKWHYNDVPDKLN